MVLAPSGSDGNAAIMLVNVTVLLRAAVGWSRVATTRGTDNDAALAIKLGWC
jgi:hypothetical protein